MKKRLLLLVAILALITLPAAAQTGRGGGGTSPFVNYSGDCQRSGVAPGVLSCQSGATCIAGYKNGGFMGVAVSAQSSCSFPPNYNVMQVWTSWQLPLYFISGSATVYRSFSIQILSQTSGRNSCDTELAAQYQIGYGC